MAERDFSELDLRAAFRALLEDAPTQVRPAELARHFATTYPRRRTLFGRWWAVRQVALIAAAAALLLAALAGGALVGARLMNKDGPSRPLPAVLSGMVAEEVKPGVYRVLNDGVRDLTPVDASQIVAGHDGGIRLLKEDGFVRLGVDRFHQWPEGVTPVSHILEIAPDGAMWVIPRLDSDYPTMRAGTGLRSIDGEEWTAQPCPSECFGVMVAPDGSVWASWGERPQTSTGRLGPSGWKPVTGPADLPFMSDGFRLFTTEAGDLYAWVLNVTDPLYRYEDGRWEHEADGGPVDVGWDGTIWHPDDLASFPGAGLARLQDGEWERWSAADLPQIGYGFGYDHQFEAAPDGSVWFSLWRSASGSDPRRGEHWYWDDRDAAVSDGRMVCDGLASFDGESLDQYLSGQCVSMDIAADGSAWVLADSEEGKALYVITPEAVVASESSRRRATAPRASRGGTA